MQRAMDNIDAEIDTLGLLCPLPVLRVRKILNGLPSGAVVRVLADDPVAAIDLPHFCTEAGHDHLGAEHAGSVQTHLIRRG